MSLLQPVSPDYGTGLTIVTGATADCVLAPGKQVILTNLGANTVYFRVSDDARPCTAADYPIPAGTQVTISKGQDQIRGVSFSVGAGSLHVMTGDGF